MNLVSKSNDDDKDFHLKHYPQRTIIGSHGHPNSFMYKILIFDPQCILMQRRRRDELDV